MRAHRPEHESPGARPRRRHPARVYWVRRAVVLTVVSALVVGVVGLGRLLAGPSDPGSDDDRAAVASTDSGDSGGEAAGSSGEGSTAGDDAGATEDVPETDPETDPEPGPETGDGRGAKPEPLPEPDGPCSEEDVLVTPSVGEAVGGRPITIRLDLTTIESEACRWQVGPETVTMRITSGSDEIWTSRQCPQAVPERSVVVRREQPRRVRVRWSARRSDEDCSIRTDWARAGYYYVEAAALAGEPQRDQFRLLTFAEAQRDSADERDGERPGRTQKKKRRTQKQRKQNASG